MNKLLLFIFAICLGACTTSRYVDIEILASSSYIINPKIKDVIVINYALEQDSSIRHRTFEQDIAYLSSDRRKRRVSKDIIKVDSTTSTAVHTMYNHLVESNIFESVVIGHEYPKSPTSVNTIVDLINENPNDVVLMLDSLIYADDLTYYHKSKDSTEVELKTRTRSQWLVYQLNNLTRPYHFATSETLYWSINDSDRAECILDAIESNTKLAAGKITPQWATVSRLYYKGQNSTYRKVEKAIELANWDATGPLWMSLYNSESKDTKQKARMAYNMALFFEMRNDLETAKMWIKTAEKIFTEKEAEEDIEMCILYAEVLNNCILNKKKLDLQFNY